MRSVIIIGAGAAGLLAARILSQKNVTVTVLEARTRIGGRIFTSREAGFSVPVENGPEFIHGNPRITRSIVKEAGVKKVKGEGRMWHINAGNVTEDGPFDESWDNFMHLLNKLETDMPIAEFLETRFKGDAFAGLRESVTRFVQGFDAADATKASAFALRKEWSDPDDAVTGYHIEGGYSSLMDFLHKRCIDQRVEFHLGAIANKIEWKKEGVVINLVSGERFRADQCIVTIPPAVLQTGMCVFEPVPDEHIKAIGKIETGGVIKFLFEFKNVIWDAGKDFRQFPEMHFIFSDGIVPTWWSQRPSNVPLLTGWLSGPITHGLSGNENLRSYGLKSLAYIFDTTENAIEAQTVAFKLINWLEDPFARGAYAYNTVDTPIVLKTLLQPIGNVIYFAGEAYNTGTGMGTVEAAFESGKEIAKRILKEV